MDVETLDPLFINDHIHNSLFLLYSNQCGFFFLLLLFIYFTEKRKKTEEEEEEEERKKKIKMMMEDTQSKSIFFPINFKPKSSVNKRVTSRLETLKDTSMDLLSKV